LPDAVIVSTCRTAIGTARKGTLADTDPFDLAGHVVAEAIARAAVDASLIDDVILGEALAGGGDIARHAAITSGVVDAPGTAVNRHCASGLAALAMGAGSIRAGMDRVVIAGGVQSSSFMPRMHQRDAGTDDWEEWWIPPSHPNTAEAPNRDMSITVGWNAAQIAGISREDMDAWALSSHEKAISAIDRGAFRDEITSFTVRRRDGSSLNFDTDEHPRRDTTLERLASLKPIHTEIEGFSITAGNSAGINDGAAAMVLASSAAVDTQRLTRLATVLAWASVGVSPIETGLAPVKAIPKALARAGLSLADVKLFEINEAFASMCVATVKTLELDPTKVNPNGSGCSLGHPIAMTGARMVITLVHELARQGGGIGVAAMCAGGGMSTAMVIEV
jgi:acetyl-CoA acetyltransferase family protein